MRNGQAYQRKTDKFSAYEEKEFGMIDSSMEDKGHDFNSAGSTVASNSFFDVSI